MASGDVRFEFRHYAFLGEASKVAAQSSECAAQQGLFFEFHDALFDQYGEGAFGNVNNKRIAAEVGVDSTVFGKCLDQGRVQKYVDSDYELATRMGVGSTPFVFINGRPVKGLADLEVYVQMIEEELASTDYSEISTGPVEGQECDALESEAECD